MNIYLGQVLSIKDCNYEFISHYVKCYHHGYTVTKRLSTVCHNMLYTV